MILYFLGSGDYGKDLLRFKEFYPNNKNIKLLNVSNLGSKKFLNFKNSNKRVFYLITIGKPSLRKLIYDKISGNKKLINSKLIFKNVTIGEKNKFNKGIIIMSNVVISSNVTIGKNCHIHPNAVIGHDVKIGNNVTIGSNVFVGGKAKIGNNCIINPNATIIKNITISSNCSVGSGSVVIHSLMKNKNVFGVPAKII